MNISEAVRTQSLLAWLTDAGPDRDTDSTGIAVSAARFLADRARRALGAGPDADQIETALRHWLAATTDNRWEGAQPARDPSAEDRLVRLADLLTPCPRPDIEGGWTWCGHAEPWPCVLTRAAWIATGDGPEDSAAQVAGDATGRGR